MNFLLQTILTQAMLQAFVFLTSYRKIEEPIPCNQQFAHLIQEIDTVEKRLPYTVVVEGNVGAGKSTFVEILAREDARISPVPEPVSAWQNVSGTGVNLLDSMFRDGKRWSGAFQLVSTLSRLQVATDLSNSKPVRIMERSIFSERYCFLETMHDNLLLSKPEYSLMDRWFQFASKHYKKYVQPDVIVYIRADLDTLKQHIKKRGREEEANLDPAFLQRLQRCHEDWLYYGNSTFGPPSSKVIVVDSQVTVEELARKVIALKDTIIPPYVFNGQ